MILCRENAAGMMVGITIATTLVVTFVAATVLVWCADLGLTGETQAQFMAVAFPN